MIDITFDTIKNHKFIWVEMYGRHKTDPDAKFIKLDTSRYVDNNNLYEKRDKTGFYFVWGWPGPDVNLYKYEDYGNTWAFDLKDIDINLATQECQ